MTIDRPARRLTARSRTARLALRVRWVERLERERDEALLQCEELARMRTGIVEALGLSRLVTVDGVLNAVGGAALGRQRAEEELRAARARTLPTGRTLDTILDAWRQVCRLVDSEGFLSPASIVDRVAVLAEQCERTERLADMVDDVGAWVASVTGEAPSPEVKLGDAVARAARAMTTEAESERARADRELGQVRDALAPDQDTGDTPLADVARASLAAHAAMAVAAELRWWSAASLVAPDDANLAHRAAHLDPAGAWPNPDSDPPTPSIFRRPTVDEDVAVEGQAAGGVEEGSPAWAVAYIDEHGIRPGIGHEALAIIKAHARASGQPVGMTVDGDVLTEVIAESMPRWMTDEAAHQQAAAILDRAVRAGMTVLHGPDLTPRVVREEVPF